MSGVFSRGGGGGSGPAPESPPAVKTVQSIPTPDPVAAPAATAAAGLGETRAPVTRATTMLSNRRAGDDVRVGTKKLPGQ